MEPAIITAAWETLKFAKGAFDYVLKQKIDDVQLKETINKMEDWERKLSQYELTKTAGGAMVFLYKGEPSHFICPKCASTNREIQFLQDDLNTYTGNFTCPGCNNTFRINRPQEPPRTAPKWNPFDNL